MFLVVVPFLQYNIDDMLMLFAPGSKKIIIFSFKDYTARRQFDFTRTTGIEATCFLKTIIVFKSLGGE